jgi:hypothetical protein
MGGAEFRMSAPLQRASWLIACAIALIPIVGITRLPARESTHATEVVAEFPNKIVVVAVRKSNPLDRTLIARFFKSPSIKKIGGRLFIVGPVHLPLSQAAHPKHAWSKGALVGIALDEVKQHHAYSFEDFSRTVFEQPPVSE